MFVASNEEVHMTERGFEFEDCHFEFIWLRKYLKCRTSRVEKSTLMFQQQDF